MSCLSWNCQGLGNPWTIRALSEFVCTHNPDLIFLIDTRLGVDGIDRIKQKLNLFGICVPSVDRSGGLALLWNKDTEVDLQSYSKNHIDARVRFQEGQDIWRLTGFYGEPDQSKRKKTWDLLKNLAQHSNRPWLVIGDYNEVLSATDKRGGAEVPAWRMRDARETFSYCGLNEIEFEGYPFTWANNQPQDQFTEVRLDKAAATMAWNTLFPTALVSHLFTRNSDHLPILLRFRRNGQRRFKHNRKRFRFEAMWIKSVDCAKVIEEHWNMDLGAMENLENCSMGLLNWDKHEFGSVRKKINELKKKLEQLHQQPRTEINQSIMKTVKVNLEQELDREEILWKQRSKTQWMAEGDRNTRFFHNQASKRARRNEISGLLDDLNVWRDDEQSMGQIVNSYFDGIFKSRNPSEADIEDVVGTMRTRVTDQINQELNQVFTAEEVKSRTTMKEFVFFVTSCWSIWSNRNKVVHEAVGYDAMDSLLFVHQYIQRFQEAQLTYHNPRPPELQPAWNAPPDDFIKLNYDASLKKNLSGVAVGVVARDNTGRVLAWKRRIFEHITCVETAEALAARSAIEFAYELDLQNIIVEGDCFNVVNQLRDSKTSLSAAGNIIEDAKNLSIFFESVSFVFIKRSGNMLAHLLANNSYSEDFGTSDLPVVNPDNVS